MSSTIQINPTSLPGCFEIDPFIFEDRRGRFVKTFVSEIYESNGLATNFAEDYYSVSPKGTLRGLHLQLPPLDHAKIIQCVSGDILDVALDVRKGSPVFGKYDLFELNGENSKALYLPPGIAHGFYVKSESATVLYKVTSPHSPGHDSGILWNSAGIPWPDTNPIVSDRDSGFQVLSTFDSPFEFRHE